MVAGIELKYMKILIVGDQHFKLDLPYSSYFEDRRKGEWNDVKNKIHEVAERCDAAVLMGDNLNSRHNNSAVIEEFVSFLKGFGDKELHILAGNHERFGEKTAIDFLKRIENPNWHVYTEPTRWYPVGYIQMMFVPYLTPAMVGAKDKEEGVVKALEILKPADIAFLHQGITGASVHGQVVDLFNEIVLPQENLEAMYGRIFTGHIHGSQELSEKTTLTGSMFTAEVGEEKKYVFVYDTDTKLTEKIELPERGVYKVTLPGDILKMEKIPKNSIVKCYITDKQVSVEEIKALLQSFDAYVIIEQYPNERQKIQIDGGALDLSLDNVLKLYAEAKNIPLQSLLSGFELIK